LRKIKGNRTIKERANTFFIDLGLLLLIVLVQINKL
jgi:hypothetical protein